MGMQESRNRKWGELAVGEVARNLSGDDQKVAAIPEEQEAKYLPAKNNVRKIRKFGP